jgi:L-asparaginase
MDENAGRNVYVLYTGGTIGMAGQPLAPMPLDAFAELIAAQPGFTKDTLQVEFDDDLDIVIQYTLDGFEQPLDSSSMTPADWVTIAERLLQNYADYDGLVVLHGTDTMAFTASALSFLLDGLDKPVVVSGAQIPLSKTRNDALRNLISAMVIAATRAEVVESTLLFDTELIRGNRSQKVDASEFPAFTAPNFPALGQNGISIEIDDALLLSPPGPERSLGIELNRKRRLGELKRWKGRYAEFSILTLTLFPGIQASSVRAMLEGTKPGVRGVVIEAFGSGNAPANAELTAILKAAHDDDGVVLVDVTQVLRGSVDLDAYQSASGLKDAGAVSGFDMTPEAALAKLVYLTGLDLKQDEIEAKMSEDLQGELSAAVRDRVLARWAALAERRPAYTRHRDRSKT